MNKEENKVDFDLSKLTLEELIKVYEEINSFIQYTEETKIVEEENEDE